MARVTVSGHPGSGTSTLVQLLTESTGWHSVNGGQIFRDEATSRGLDLVEFAELCSTNREIDALLDKRLKELLRDEHGPEIIESRLAGHWASDQSLDIERIWIQVDIAERARRVCNREGGMLDERMQEILARTERDEKRYNEYYNISLDDMTPYTMIIDSSALSATQTFDEVMSRLNTEMKQ